MKPSWLNTCRSMLFVLVSVIRRKWQKNIISKSRTNISSRRRFCTECTAEQKRQRNKRYYHSKKG